MAVGMDLSSYLTNEKRILSRMKEQRVERSELQKRVSVSLFWRYNSQTAPDDFETHFHTV